jgi:integrase
MKIFERSDKPTGKGNPLEFYIRHNGHQYKIRTGYHCKPGSWDQRSQSVITTGKDKDPMAFQINGRLKRAIVALEDIIASQKPFNITIIRNKYRMYLGVPETPKDDDAEITKHWKEDDWKRYNESPNKDTYMIFERILFGYKNVWSFGKKNKMTSLRTKILEYQPTFHPSMITKEWWRRFVDYCIEQRGNLSNTINADTASLKSLIKELRPKGYKFEDDLEDAMQWSYVEPNKLGLSWEKVLRIINVNLTNNPNSTIRDSQIAWAAGALTGRRWGEVENMGPGNFYQQNGQWRYRNVGKGQRSIDIPLLPEAVEFLTKINFHIPRMRGARVNLDIKEIAKLTGLNQEIFRVRYLSKNKVNREVLPEYKTVTVHTGRHSFAQHIAELAAGKPHAEKFVSFMLGHASFQTTWKYMNRAANSNDKMFEEIINQQPDRILIHVSPDLVKDLIPDEKPLNPPL